MRTSGGLKRSTKRNPETNKKRRHATVMNDNYSVTTASSLQSTCEVFFRQNNDYALVLLCGTEDHDQLVVVQKKSIAGKAKQKAYHAKVYDPNPLERKLTLPVRAFIRKLNLQPNQYASLMYCQASHLLSNVGSNCAVYVALKARNCLVYGQIPFNRNILFYKPKKK